MGKWGKSQDKGLRGFLSPCTTGLARDFWSPGSSGVGRDFSRPCSNCNKVAVVLLNFRLFDSII